MHTIVLTEKEVLDTLDNYRNGYDPAFVQLGHPYVYPIDSRMNVFRNNQAQWALAIEVLGYSPRSEPIGLEITYYGNCLINLDDNGEHSSNSYCVLPIDEESFYKTIEHENLKSDADNWIVRGNVVELSHLKEEYVNAGVELKGYEPNEISAEEVGRLLVTKHRDLFRATDEELYKCIPKELEKILVIDEWYHKDFYQQDTDFTDVLQLTDFNQESFLNQFFEANQDKFDNVNIAKDFFSNLVSGVSESEKKREETNQEQWDTNRPGSYETWQQIAKVIVTGDTSFYMPTLQPTSHWSNWPDAGTM